MNKKKSTIALLSLLSLTTLQNTSNAAVVDGNSFPYMEYSSDLDPTRTYDVRHFTFDLNTAITIQKISVPAGSHSFSNIAYDFAGAQIQRIEPNVNFISDTSNTFDGNYRHRVIFSQIDTFENNYTAFAISYNNNIQNCNNISNINIDNNGNLIAISLGAGAAIPNSNCDNQIIDTGLIVFNTNLWNSTFNPGGFRGGGTFNSNTNLWEPPLVEQEHWILHEFTHLLGLSHRREAVNSVGCAESVMILSLLNIFCRNDAPPTSYTADDLDVLNQIGY